MALLIIFVALAIGCGLVARMWRPRRLTMLEQLRLADLQLSAERRRARRAMNDAAGQSWRNMVE